MAFPDEVVALDERARPAFRWVMRSRKFDRNGDDWEGEVVPAHDPGPSRARSRPARTWPPCWRRRARDLRALRGRDIANREGAGALTSVGPLLLMERYQTC